MHRWIIALAAAALVGGCGREPEPKATPNTTPGAAQEPTEKMGARAAGCDQLPGADDLKRYLREAPQKGEAGGLFSGRFEWGAIVNRQGEVCALAVATDDAAAAWPGSRGIALAKAYTANAFSTDFQPMSTARLYTLSLPGHSLWSAANGNPMNPVCLGPAENTRNPNVVCGGTIVFGGGLPLYKGKTRVGGLGVSGDTPCADHEIAKRVRSAAGLNPDKGEFADDIQYTKVDGPTWYAHPLCPNTWRNGQKIGDEAPATGY
jgi:uncharacterized protein GlcG (DUF336 family)